MDNADIISELRAIKEQLVAMNTREEEREKLNHESRIRTLETNQAKLMGLAAAVGLGGAGLSELLQRVLGG